MKLEPTPLATNHLGEVSSSEKKALQVRRIDTGFLEEGADGTIRHVNTAFCRLTGLSESPRSFVARPSSEVMNLVQRTLPEFAEFRRHVLEANDSDVTSSATVEVDQGASRVLEITYLARLRDGDTIAHIWTIRDVADHRVAVERLRFQAEVLAQVSDAVVTVGPDMAIKYWNKGAELLTGFPAEKALGKGPEELLQFRFEKAEEEHEAWGVLADRGTWSGEIIISTPHTDGDRYIHAAANVLYDSDGEFNGLLAVMRDDTERREM